MKVLKVQQALLEQHLWLLLLLDQNTTLNLSNNVHIKHNTDDNLNDENDNNKSIVKKKWKDDSELSSFSLESEPIIEINPDLCTRRPAATTIIDCATTAPVGATRSSIELPCRTKLRKNYYNLRYNSCICSSNEYTTFCHPIRLPMPMPVPVPVPLQSNLFIAPRRLRRTCTIFNPFSIAFLLLIVLSGDLWPHTKSVLTGLHISVGVYYVSCATWPRPSTPLLTPSASSGLPASSLRPLLMPHLRHHFSNRLKMWQKYLKHSDSNGSKIVNHHPHSLPYSSSLSVFPFSSSYSLQSSTLSKSNLYPHKNKYFFTNINNDNTDNGIKNDSLSFSSLTDDAAEKTADTSDTRIVLINTISSKNIFVKLNSSGDMFLKSSLPSPLSTEAAVPVAAAAAMTTPPQFLKRSSRNLKQFRVFSPGSFSPPFSSNSNNVVVVGGDSSTTGTSSDNNDNQKEIMKSILSKISKSTAMKKPRTTTTTTATIMTKAKATSKAASTGPLFSPCSHIGDEINEISARAFIADVVFEGKVRSRSTEKDASGKYGVTFVVQRVYKDEMPATAAAATATLNAASPLVSAFKIGAPASPPTASIIEAGLGSGTGAATNTGTASLQNTLWPKQQVRLFFMEKSSTANFTKPMAHCFQRYHFTKKQAELTKANIKRGRRYIVFINRIAPHNYTVVGEPVPSTKRNFRAVNEVLCRSCVRQIGVWGLKNESVNAGEQLRLVCRMRGTPLPALQWFKDGAPIIVTSRLRIQYKKKRSLLVIPKVRNSDSGKYECRGVGVQSSSPVSSTSIVTINAKIDNITALWPLVGKSCPMYLVYCLNGGSCTYYETIGEFTCQCADGFNGGRCENKDVVNSNSTYEPITCYDGVTPSYPCVTVHKPIDYSYYPP